MHLLDWWDDYGMAKCGIARHMFTAEAITARSRGIEEGYCNRSVIA